MTYFNDLNYSLGNEDTNLETKLVEQFRPKKIISVCGSGSRALPLLFESVEELTLVDLAPQQIYLARLRLSLIKACSHEEFLKFFGYPPFDIDQNIEFRKEIFEKLPLNNDTRQYFEQYFEEYNWNSILYTGKWEKTFVFFSKIIRKFISKFHIEKMFSFTCIDEQRKYFKESFPRLRWKVILFILGNKQVFNTLLYKGDFIKKNVNESFLKYYTMAFDNIFNHILVKDSFFLHLCFNGKINSPDGNINEADPNVFQTMKKNAQTTKIIFKNKDIISAIKEDQNIDFVSISDVPSYFSGVMEKEFLKRIIHSLNDKAIVVNRNYLRIPDADRTGFEDIANDYRALIRTEKLQMYRIEILKKI